MRVVRHTLSRAVTHTISANRAGASVGDGFDAAKVGGTSEQQAVVLPIVAVETHDEFGRHEGVDSALEGDQTGAH